jgi:hypothetical protein
MLKKAASDNGSGETANSGDEEVHGEGAEEVEGAEEG